LSRAAHSTADAVRFDATNSYLLLRNRTGELQADLRTGGLAFSIKGGGRAKRLTAYAFVDTAKGRLSTPTSPAPLRWARVSTGRDAGVAVEFSRELPRGVHLHWRIAAAASGFEVRVGVRGGGDPITSLGLAFPAEEGFLGSARRPHALKIAYCGAHSQSPLSRSEVVAIRPSTVLRSWWATAWYDATAETGFVLGYLEARALVGRFNLIGFRGEACNFVENVIPASNAITWAEPLWVAPAVDVCDALKEYGRQVGARSPGIVSTESSWGWSSWTHFADSVNEKRVLANARAMGELDVASVSAPLVHVDHGWEEQFRTHRPKAYWRSRPQFGHSMPNLASMLKQEGRRLGLWVVPFAINSDGPIARSLRTAVLRDSAGAPQPVVGKGCYCVDPTSPAGEAWLRRLFTRLTGWGINHFKLDFLRVLVALDPDDRLDGLTKPRRFHRPMSRLEAYRHGLGIIRDTVGPRVHLLACGAPLLPSAGLVDSIRTGSDIDASWAHGHTGIGRCAESVRCNFFWHGQVWRNDPDCLAVPKDARYLRYWAATVAIAGGSALVSADIPKLTQVQRATLSRFIPALPGLPKLLGLTPIFGSSRICQVLMAHGEPVWIVALFNRGAATSNQRIALKELPGSTRGAGLAWDVLAECPLEKSMRTWSLAVAPRDVRIICVRMDLSRPQIIGTSGHIGMELMGLTGVVWDARSNILRIKRGTDRSWPERIYLHVPFSFRLAPGAITCLDGPTRTAVLSLRGTRSHVLAISFLSAG